MAIRILLVEDEFITLDLLRDYVERSGYKVSGDAMSAPEAIDILERFDTDLVILDIRIRGEHDGVWLASQIREHYNVPFIFLTANSDIANVRRAAETYPYGYLVKPFTEADIMAAIEVALKQHEKELKADRYRPVKAQHVELEADTNVFLRDAQTYRRVLIGEIKYVQAFKNYIEIGLTDETTVVLRSTLYKFMEILPKSAFKQTHRSFAVNIQHITHINGEFVVLGNKKLPLSKSFRDSLFEGMTIFG